MVRKLSYTLKCKTSCFDTFMYCNVVALVIYIYHSM